MLKDKHVRDILIVVLLLLIMLSCKVCFANEIVAHAMGQVGNGEIRSNNKGIHVKNYNRGLEAPWCAGFVSYILEKSNVEFEYNLSARKFWNLKDKRVTSPQSGDVICFWRDKPNSWKGHVGIVKNVTDQYIYTIEGNVGSFPAKVKVFKYNRNNVPKLLGYVRLK